MNNVIGSYNISSINQTITEMIQHNLMPAPSGISINTQYIISGIALASIISGLCCLSTNEQIPGVYKKYQVILATSLVIFGGVALFSMIINTFVNDGITAKLAKIVDQNSSSKVYN